MSKKKLIETKIDGIFFKDAKTIVFKDFPRYDGEKSNLEIKNWDKIEYYSKKDRKIKTWKICGFSYGWDEFFIVVKEDKEPIEPKYVISVKKFILF